MRNLVSIILFAIPVGAAAAGDAARGKQKSNTCVACHGLQGISVNSLWPNIAGQKEEYLVNQIKAFRDGGRRDPLMTPVSKMLSDQEIADLAAYFSQLKGAP